MPEVFDGADVPWRAVVAATGLAILAVLGIRDLARNRRDPKRAEEYAFLLGTTVTAAVYGIAHDQVTATISPEYFLQAKGLATDPHPLRVAVALLAIRATWWAGLAIGTALLLANNPRPDGHPPQLPYRSLVRIAAVPLFAAVAAALVAATINALDPLGLTATARTFVAADRVRAFLIVWGAHAGSYAGALLGTVHATYAVVARRRKTSVRPI